MAKVLPLLVASCLLFSLFSEQNHVYSQSPKETDSVMTVVYQRLRVCGMVALDANSEASCCGPQLVFHRPTQRCCSVKTVKTVFFVIHKNPDKTEAEDCRSYTA